MRVINPNVVILTMGSVIVALVASITTLLVLHDPPDTLVTFGVGAILPTFAGLLAYGKATEASANSAQTVVQTNGLMHATLSAVAASGQSPAAAPATPTAAATAPASAAPDPAPPSGLRAVTDLVTPTPPPVNHNPFVSPNPAVDDGV